MSRSIPPGRSPAGRECLCLMLALAAGFVAPAAFGPAWAFDPVPAAPVWHCWLRDGPVYNVVCMPGTLPEAPVVPAEETESQSVAVAQPADWAFEKTRLMRARPDDYGPTVWIIPVYTLPYDQEAVVQLLRIVLCPGNRDCRIAYLGETS